VADIEAGKWLKVCGLVLGLVHTVDLVHGPWYLVNHRGPRLPPATDGEFIRCHFEYLGQKLTLQKDFSILKLELHTMGVVGGEVDAVRASQGEIVLCCPYYFVYGVSNFVFSD